MKENRLNYEITQLKEKPNERYKKDILGLMEELTPGMDSGSYLEKYSALEKFILNQSAVLFVSILNSGIIGYIWGYERENREERRLHVTQFVVSAEYRGMGIGNKLLSKMKDYIDRCGVKRMELNVLPTNIRGIRFYLNNQFEPESILMRQTGNCVCGGGYSYVFN